MFRRWRGAFPGSGTPSPPESARETPTPQNCPGLVKVLERTFRLEHPSILDLGPSSGPSITALANRGARIAVESFEPPPHPAPEADDDTPVPPIRLDHADASFDLVLVWDWLDYVAPDRLAEFGAEIVRVLKVGGWILAFSSSKKDPERDVAAEYRIVEEDRLMRVANGRARRRWPHPNRDIERSLEGLSVQGIHLQRNQVREFVAVKGTPRR